MRHYIFFSFKMKKGIINEIERPTRAKNVNNPVTQSTPQPSAPVIPTQPVIPEVKLPEVVEEKEYEPMSETQEDLLRLDDIAREQESLEYVDEHVNDMRNPGRHILFGNIGREERIDNKKNIGKYLLAGGVMMSILNIIM